MDTKTCQRINHQAGPSISYSMQKINSESDLSKAILQLEARQMQDVKILKEQFHLTYESIKPINLIKNTFKQVGESSELKDNVINTSVGLATGYVSKILFEKLSGSPVKKLLGSVLMFGISNLVTKNPDVIKSFGNNLLNKISNKFGSKANETDKAEVLEIVS